MVKIIIKTEKFNASRCCHEINYPTGFGRYYTEYVKTKTNLIVKIEIEDGSKYTFVVPNFKLTLLDEQKPCFELEFKEEESRLVSVKSFDIRRIQLQPNYITDILLDSIKKIMIDADNGIFTTTFEGEINEIKESN